MDFEPQKDLNVPPDAHAVFRAAVIDYGFGLYEILPRDLQSLDSHFWLNSHTDGP